MMGGDALSGVGRIEADELDAHRFLRDGGHDAEKARAFLDGEDAPQRLKNLPRGERPQGGFHRVDERIPFEDGANARFADIGRRDVPGGADHLSDALIASSAFEPGQSSASASSFSGRSVVFIVSCNSSTSRSR